MAKEKPPKKPLIHSETKSLLLFASSFLFFLSLISFYQGASSRNLLGIFGYIVGWCSFYLCGLGSYVLVAYLIWLGWEIFSTGQIKYLNFKNFCLSLFLISLCLTLNVFSENFPKIFSFLEKRVFTEWAYFSLPYPHTYIRYNAGGAPLYYFYRDLPFFNLQNILSDVGISIIFLITGTISFLLLTGIQLIPNLEIAFNHSRSIIKRAFVVLKALFQEIPSACKQISEVSSIKKPLEKIKELNPKKIMPEVKEKTSSIIIKQSTTLTSKGIKEPKLAKEESSSSYTSPSIDLLNDPPKIDQPSIRRELQRQAAILEETLRSFGIEAKVGEINCGPSITSFEVHPSIGVKVQKITALESDIALNLQAKSIRIVAPIPGKAAVGVEIPSLHPQPVNLKEMLLYYNQSKKKLNIPLLLGKSVSGEYVIADLVRMPHCVIAGATGSGKSVCINTIVMSILMNASPNDIRLLMIDPKKVELTQYSKLPHMIAPVITEPSGAYAAMQWLVKEMQNRYEILKQLGLRNISAFNARKINKELEASLSITIPEHLPFIVAIVDEFADLMMVSSADLETPIARIAQMARAVGIHLILATQRPSREVITGIIKANFPSRIAFKVASRVNSQIILDEIGAESLLGNGDLLFLPPGTSQMIRAQGAYISDEEINRVINEVCKNIKTQYLIESFDQYQKLEETNDMLDEKMRDSLFETAKLLVLQSRTASTTFLQRKLKIGYARAASLMDELEEEGIIGPQEGSKPRRILSLMANDLPLDNEEVQ